jgi:hypothetical protein
MIGYGTDTWCGDSLVTGRMSRGVMTVALSQYRCLITPKGTLRGIADDEEEFAWGFDVSALVGTMSSQSAVGALPGMIAAELAKDDRVYNVIATVTAAANSSGHVEYDISVTSTLVESDVSFVLTMHVDDVTAALTGVTVQ